jgi:flagellar basal-body rod modification protein FlgD
MSTLNTVLPTSAVQSAATSTSGANSFSSLSPSDFVQMMVTQLQNQDPLDPTSSQDILSQMSQIGQLQSADQLQSTLSGLALQNQIGAASSLIGKQVTGINASNARVSGNVTSVSIAQATTSGGAATVTLGLDNGGQLPLSGVTAITPGAAATTATTGTVPTAPTAPAAAAAAAAAAATPAAAPAVQPQSFLSQLASTFLGPAAN